VLFIPSRVYQARGDAGAGNERHKKIQRPWVSGAQRLIKARPRWAGRMSRLVFKQQS
jgi:hypothetical protein